MLTIIGLVVMFWSCSAQNMERDTLAVELNDMGVEYMMQGNSIMGTEFLLDSAVLCFSEAIQIDSTYKMAYGNLASCYHTMGNYEAFLEISDLAVAHFEDDSELIYLRGMAYGCNGMYKEAQQDFESALKLYDKKLKKSWTAFDEINRACTLLLLNRQNEGIENLEAVKEKDDLIKDWIEQLKTMTKNDVLLCPA